MVTAVFIGQVGNGGAAIKGGNHASQKAAGGGGGGGGAAKSGGGGPISATEIVEQSIGTTKYYEFTIRNGNADGTDANVMAVSGKTFIEGGKTAYSFNFTVNGDFVRDGNLRSEAGALISANVNKAFRKEIASRRNGTRFVTSPAGGDGRGNFREAMYAKQGFSFSGGGTSPSRGGGEQFGVVKNGRLVPADKKGNALKKDDLAAHQSNLRQALKQAIRDSRSNVE